MGKKIFTFSGQGSQYIGMGLELYESHSLFKYWMDKANSLILEIADFSILNELYLKKTNLDQPLVNLEISHPTLFAVQYATAKVVQESIQADLLIGASLGEFVAIAVSESIDFEEALNHVINQAKLFTFGCEKGSMIFVLSEKERIDEILNGLQYEYSVDSSPGNYTLSTTLVYDKQIQERLKKAGILYQKMPVQFPFHSKWIEKAEYPFRWMVKNLNHKKCKVPIASCASLEMMSELNETYLWDILREKVRLKETLVKFVNPLEDMLFDMSPAGSIVASLKSIFGSESFTCKNSFKTLSPFKNGDKNLKKIESLITSLE